MVSEDENMLLWKQHIDERNKSGMTVKDWCEKNGLSKHKYNYWNHKIITKEKPIEEMVFTEVTPILSERSHLLSNSNKCDDFQILYKDMQVTVPSNFNKNSFAGLMKVLQEKVKMLEHNVEGTKASAIIFSIINTATANNLDAYKYLKYIFCQLPNINFLTDSSVLEKYLPWSEEIQLNCKVDKTENNHKDEAISELA